MNKHKSKLVMKFTVEGHNIDKNSRVLKQALLKEFHTWVKDDAEYSIYVALDGRKIPTQKEWRIANGFERIERNIDYDTNS